jgi:hypothetical protein
MKYTCECCEFTTIYKNDYARHLDTKKHKHLAEISFSLAEISPPEKPYICEYCDKVFKHQSSLCKHIKYTCKKNKDEDLKEFVRLLNEKIDKMQSTVELQNNMIQERENEIKKRDKELDNLHKKINKLSSKLQIKNVNNNVNKGIINNTKIVLNNYRDTDMSHLTDKDFKFLIKQVNFCIPKMIEKIHFNPEKPENMNVYISNKKEKYIMIFNDFAWKLKDRDSELNKMLIRNFGAIEEWYKNSEQGSKFKWYFDKLESNLDDKALEDEIKEHMKLVLYNNRHTLEKLLEDFDDVNNEIVKEIDIEI